MKLRSFTTKVCSCILVHVCTTTAQSNAVLRMRKGSRIYTLLAAATMLAISV
jgi:hypothetical protein